MNKTLRLTLLSLLMLVCGVWSSEAFADTKWVKTAASALQTGDVVAIVDLTSGGALPNTWSGNKGPAIVEVTVNGDKTELTSEVDATLQWEVTVDNGSYTFQAGENDYLYCIKDNNGVRHGSSTETAFTIEQSNGKDYLKHTANSRYFGVYTSNLDWRCYTSVNANIKDSETVFYKKTTTQPAQEVEEIALTGDMFFNWDGDGANAVQTSAASVESHYGEELAGGNVVIGTGGVLYLTYADLTGSTKMLFEGTQGLLLRVLMNRQESNSGPLVEKQVTIGEDGKAELDLTEFDFVHLNAIKLGYNGVNGSVTSIKLVRPLDPLALPKEALKNVITAAKNINAYGKEEGSFNALTDAIAVAEGELANASATEESLADAKTALQQAIDNVVLAEGYSVLTADMFKHYASLETPGEGSAIGCAYELNVESGLPYGDGNVGELNWADLANYDKLIVITKGATEPRFCMNRLVAGGQQGATKEESNMIDINDNNGNAWSATAYQTIDGNVYIIDLKKIVADYGFARLHSIKKQGFGAGVFVTDLLLYKAEEAPVITDDIIVNSGFELSPASTANLAGGSSAQGTDYTATGWKLIQSASWSNSAIVKYGSATLGGFATPATDKNGNGNNALAIVLGWGGTQKYESAVEVTLPAGKYVLTADAYNVSNQATYMKSLLGFAVTGGATYTSTKTSFTTGTWETDQVSFFLPTETTGKFIIGGVGKDGSGQAGSAKVLFDNLKLDYTPVSDVIGGGTYYLYNEKADRFLGRGSEYSTAAVVAPYGLPITFNLVDDDTYQIKVNDNGANLGFDAFMYTDAGGTNVRNFTVTAVSGGYTLTNTNNNMLAYVYMKEDGNKYRVAGNAIKGDNYDDDAQTVWQFLSQEEYDAKIAARDAAQVAAAEQAAAGNIADLVAADTQVATFATGSAWTVKTVRRSDDGSNVRTTADGSEMWNAAGFYTQTITNLPAGVYKVGIKAFYRSGNSADVLAHEAFGNAVLAYLDANGSIAQIKSWSSDASRPNDMGSANAAFGEGKYLSETYAIVGEDGILNLKVSNESFVKNTWFIAKEVTYSLMLNEHMAALVSEIAKAEELADALAPMVGWLYDAIDEAKAVYANTAATAEELDAAVAALQQAEADYQSYNETTIQNLTNKVNTGNWEGQTGVYGRQVTTSTGNTVNLVENYGNSEEGWKLRQTITGLDNGYYNVKLFATSHNAWNKNAVLQNDADNVAYVFANDEKTYFTARRDPGMIDSEVVPHAINNVLVKDGKLTIGMALAIAGQTEWHTIQIYDITREVSSKYAYTTSKQALQNAIAEAQAWADNAALTNGKETLNETIAAAQLVYESNKVTIEQVDAAAAAVRAAVKAYIEANPAEIANGAYYVKNNNGLFLAAGADWGTHAVVNETGLDYTFALADGKYTLDSQVSNGGNNNFLNGVWNDGAAMGWGIYKVSETEVIITDGNAYLAPNGNNVVELVSEITDAAKWTIVAAADRQAELLATLDAATATNGVDATFLLKGANFNRNDLRNSAWVVSRSGGNQTIAGPSENRGTYGCESWNNTFEVKQALTDLPQGVYEFQMAGYGTNGTTMIYGDVVFGTTMAPFVNTTSAANFRTALDAIANGEFTGNTSGKFIVTDGNATVGVKRDVNQAADWAVFDNARLVYFGNDLSFYVEAYEKAVAAANAIKDKKMSAAAKSVLDEALATYGDVDRESREAMIEAVPVLNEATAAAKAAIEAYEVAKAALNDIAAVLNKTNVYTPEAYSAFKVDFEAKRRAFKEGELTDEEAIAIREAILPTGYRQDNTIDDLLLSAWSVNGEQCKDYEKALYINTWSTEGDTDGSGFKAPFFEYYSNQENEFTATMNNVEPGIYNVTAWVRVRSGNDEPAAGVTFQANDTEAVDVCDGDELWSGANHFFLKNVETVATVAEDGVLTLTFKVAAGNNCNWLSFKDVMFTMDVQATANAEKAAQMADAQGQVDDAKAELADAILAAQEVYNTGDVRYPSAVELAEAIVNAQAALDGTADLTKLSQLNKTLVALNNALDEINNAKDAAEANLMGEHVIYFWPAGTEQANEITLAEGVTLAITGNTSKKIQNGSNVTVYGKKYTSMKVSNGAQNTLTTQKYVKSITFYSYINKKHDADGLRDSYWKEVAGVAYDAETSGGLMSLYSDGNLTKPEGRYFEISDKDHPTKTVTFNNAGEQLCYVMDVEYWDETVGVEEVSAARLVKAEDVYNLQGQKVERPVKGGLYIVGGRKVVVK